MYKRVSHVLWTTLDNFATGSICLIIQNMEIFWIKNIEISNFDMLHPAVSDWLSDWRTTESHTRCVDPSYNYSPPSITARGNYRGNLGTRTSTGWSRDWVRQGGGGGIFTVLHYTSITVLHYTSVLLYLKLKAASWVCLSVCASVRLCVCASLFFLKIF